MTLLETALSTNTESVTRLHFHFVSKVKLSLTVAFIEDRSEHCWGRTPSTV